ncbi:MAG: choice-of-anchor tandem repeat GloVer-containing protein [Verrucomicrobiia bacterium]
MAALSFTIPNADAQTETVLYSFGSSPNDGNDPHAGLVQGSDGDFYGTTWAGGTHGQGTVFKLSVPLNPPANHISAFQIMGNDVAVSIPSVAYETYQLQFTTDLACGTWSNVPGVSVTNSIGALLTLTNSGGAVGPQGFYRFAITP